MRLRLRQRHFNRANSGHNSTQNAGSSLKTKTSDGSLAEEDIGGGTDNRVATQTTSDVWSTYCTGNDVAAWQKYDSHRAIVAALAGAHVSQSGVLLL